MAAPDSPLAAPAAPSPTLAGPGRELTWRGMALGVVICAVFTAANVYFGLKAGLTFASSIPAAFRASSYSLAAPSARWRIYVSNSRDVRV